MMNFHKVIVVGPRGSGKRSAIEVLSDKSASACSDLAPSGVMQLESGMKIQLFYASGKERIDYMWEMLSNNCLGLIFLLDNSRKDPIKDLHEYCRTYGDFIASSVVAVGVTKMDINDKPMLHHYHRYLKKISLKALVFEVDARRREDLSMLVNALFYSSVARSASRSTNLETALS